MPQPFRANALSPSSHALPNQAAALAHLTKKLGKGVQRLVDAGIHAR